MLAAGLAALIALSDLDRSGGTQTPPGDTVVVTRNVMVPMRDGVRLATDIYSPAKNGLALEGRDAPAETRSARRGAVAAAV
jgi:predicted acyl esterase